MMKKFYFSGGSKMLPRQRLSQEKRREDEEKFSAERWQNKIKVD